MTKKSTRKTIKKTTRKSRKSSRRLSQKGGIFGRKKRKNHTAKVAPTPPENKPTIVTLQNGKNLGSSTETNNEPVRNKYYNECKNEIDKENSSPVQPNYLDYGSNYVSPTHEQRIEKCIKSKENLEQIAKQRGINQSLSYIGGKRKSHHKKISTRKTRKSKSKSKSHK